MAAIVDGKSSIGNDLDGADDHDSRDEATGGDEQGPAEDAPKGLVPSFGWADDVFAWQGVEAGAEALEKVLRLEWVPSLCAAHGLVAAGMRAS